MNSTSSKQCVAEFIGTFTLICVGIAAVANNTPMVGLGFYGRFLIKESKRA
jgi:glycerol uptake facilitator-like aquaporin